MTYLILSFCIFLISRIYFSSLEAKNAFITSGDSIAHLTYVNQYKINNGKNCNLNSKYILDGPGYPTGYHKLFYILKIPICFIEKYGGYFPILFDACHIFIIYFGIAYFGGPFSSWLLFLPFLRCFWGNEGRAAHFSERAFGTLLGNIFLISSFLFYQEKNIIFLVFGFAAFFSLLLCSKFAHQAVLFYSLLFTIINSSIFFLGFYICCLALTLIFSRQTGFEIVLGHFRHSYFYKTHLQKKYPELRDSFSDLIYKNQTFIKYLALLSKNSLLRIFTDMPVMFAVAQILIQNLDQVNNTCQLFGWISSGILIVILIATNSLKFLGEPERYLEFLVFPVFLFLSFHDPKQILIGTVLSGFCAFYIFAFSIYNYYRNFKPGKQQTNDLLELKKFVKKLKSGLILTAPCRLSFFLGYKNPKKTYLTIFSHVGLGEKYSSYKWLINKRYPFPRENLLEIIKRFKINYFILEKKSCLHDVKKFLIKYKDLNKFVRIFNNNSYSVYHV